MAIDISKLTEAHRGRQVICRPGGYRCEQGMLMDWTDTELKVFMEDSSTPTICDPLLTSLVFENEEVAP